MKINLKSIILDYEDKPLIEAGTNESLEYFDVFVKGLNANIHGEMLTAEKKNEIYQITKKLYANPKEVKLTVEQLALIKERVGKAYNPIVYGRVCDLIDGTGSKIDKEPAETPKN